MANFYTEKLLLDIELASQIGVTNAIVYEKVKNILQISKATIDGEQSILLTINVLIDSLGSILSRETVKRALNFLVKNGYLQKNTYNQNSTFYSLARSKSIGGSSNLPTVAQNKQHSVKKSDRGSSNLPTVNNRVINNNQEKEKDIIINNNIQKEREKMSLKELKELCKKISPVLYARHSEDINADYQLAKIYRELTQTLTREEIEELLIHANATYIVQPKYNKLDLAWVLNHHKQVLQAERIEERTRDKPKREKRNYDEE